MQQAHAHFAATGDKQAIEDIVAFFETNLKNQYLSKIDFEKYLARGSDALRTFFDKKYDSFNPSEKAEVNFSNQHSIVDKAHLTGKLDLANIDKSGKIMAITDYKTGRPTLSWSGKSDFDKIKLHRYKQQLLFYKLLVEHARDWRGYSVESGVMQYIEPTMSGDIVSLETGFNSDELNNFAKLINIVWDHIIELNLPDTSAYDQSYKGILTFEQDLIDGKI
jgi:DNA helicase-2/ATP-dependent DNA helicase PcrA